MRTNRAFVLALLSGILGACGQPGATPGGGSTPVPTGWFTGPTRQGVQVGDLLLETSVRSDGPGALVVDYAILNLGSEAMLVHDRVPTTLGSATLPDKIDPEKTWVFMTDGRIRLSKQGFAPAPGVRFIAAPVTGARALEAGDQLSGEARAPLPLTLSVPGEEFDVPREPLDPAAREWQFCVQVTKGPAGRPSAGDPTILEVPAAAPGAGELLCSEPRAVASGAVATGKNASGTP